MQVGSIVKLRDDYKPGSNTVDYEWAVIEKIFTEYSMPEAWLTTDKGYKIIEYLEYLEEYL